MINQNTSPTYQKTAKNKFEKINKLILFGCQRYLKSFLDNQVFGVNLIAKVHSLGIGTFSIKFEKKTVPMPSEHTSGCLLPYLEKNLVFNATIFH